MARPRKERTSHRLALSRDDQEYFETIDLAQAKRKELGIKVDSKRFMKEFAPKQWNPDLIKVTPLEMKKRKHDDAVDKAFKLFYESGCQMHKMELVEKTGAHVSAIEEAFGKAGISFHWNSDRD